MKMIVAVSKKNKKCNKPKTLAHLKCAKKKEIHHRNSMKHYSTIKNYNDYETIFILASKKDEKRALCYECNLVKIFMSTAYTNESFCGKWRE